MKYPILKFILSGVFFIVVLCSIYPAHAWQVPVEVSSSTETGERFSIKMIVGVEKGATDGFDNLWDTPALSSHPDPDREVLLSAYIKGKEETGHASQLWKDIRGEKGADNTEWIIRINKFPKGNIVSVRWDIPAGMFRPGEQLVLRDNDRLDANGNGVETNVSETAGYEFMSDGDAGRSLSLVFTRESSGRSSQGSGFGCGVVKINGEGPGNKGISDIIFIMLLSPFVLRFFRNLQKRLT